MASKRKDRYGYECNWAEKPPEDLECLICELVARDPYRCTTVKCGKVFCNNCRNSLYRRSVAPHCPNCGEKLNTCKDGRGRCIKINYHILKQKYMMLFFSRCKYDQQPEGPV